jgi:hypothetical protein
MTTAASVHTRRWSLDLRRIFPDAESDSKNGDAAGRTRPIVACEKTCRSGSEKRVLPKHRSDRRCGRRSSIGSERQVCFVGCHGEGFKLRTGHRGSGCACGVGAFRHRDVVAGIGEANCGGISRAMALFRAQCAAQGRDEHCENRESRDRSGKTHLKGALHSESQRYAGPGAASNHELSGVAGGARC